MFEYTKTKPEIEKDLVPYTTNGKEDVETTQCGTGEVGGLPLDYYKGYRKGYRDGIEGVMKILNKKEGK